MPVFLESMSQGEVGQGEESGVDQGVVVLNSLL